MAAALRRLLNRKLLARVRDGFSTYPPALCGFVSRPTPLQFSCHPKIILFIFSIATVQYEAAMD